MGSSRLPGKTMMPIFGKPMIERMIERVRYSRYIYEIVIATTELTDDDILAAFANQISVGCFRGPAEDVLGRINATVAANDIDLVVELLGDNPLVHSDLIDDVMDFYHAGQCDYAASVTTEYPQAGPEVKKFPIGIRVQVFPRSVLERCEELARDPSHREHSTNYIYEHPERFSLGHFEAKGKWAKLNRPELTFAVNYQKNVDLVSRIFERCYPAEPNFGLPAVIRAFDADPALRALMGK